MATIGLPFTVVPGYFGMSFEIMPWLERPWELVAASAPVLARATGAVLPSRRRDRP